MSADSIFMPTAGPCGHPSGSGQWEWSALGGQVLFWTTCKACDVLYQIHRALSVLIRPGGDFSLVLHGRGASREAGFMYEGPG